MIKAFDETLKHALDDCEKRDGSDSSQLAGSAEVLELKKEVAMYRTMCLAAYNEIMSEIEAHTDKETGLTCCNLLARLSGKIGPDIYPTWATDEELELFMPNDPRDSCGD